MAEQMLLEHTSEVIRVLDHGSKRTLALRPAWSASGAPVLHYQLEHVAAATLEVFNVQGQRVESRLLTGGSTGWNTAPLKSHPAGVYMARITQNRRSETARVVVIH